MLYPAELRGLTAGIAKTKPGREGRVSVIQIIEAG
jgi:hypothetical protein